MSKVCVIYVCEYINKEKLYKYTEIVLYIDYYLLFMHII